MTRDKINGLIKQVDKLGENIEAAHILWLSPKADDNVREIYAHLHAIGDLLDTCLQIAEIVAAQIAKDAEAMGNKKGR